MGDRTSIRVEESETNEGIWLYTHWGGYRALVDLQLGLIAGEGRWNDGPYLARVIFCHMVPEDQIHGILSFGIWSEMLDHEYPFIMIVDVSKQEIRFHYFEWKNHSVGDCFKIIPISVFCELDAEKLLKCHKIVDVEKLTE